MNPRQEERSKLLSLVSANVLGGGVSWNLTNLGGAPESVAAHYGVSFSTVGLLGTVLFLAQLLLIVPGGRLIDRIGARRAGLLCLVLVAGANASVLVLPGFTAALVLRFVVGAAIGVGFVAGATYVRVAEGRAMAQGIYGGTTIGIAGVAVAVVAFLEPIVGWRAPFLSAAVAATFGLLVLSLSPDIQAFAPEPVQTQQTEFRTLATDRRVWQFAAATAATFGASVVLGNWAVPLLTRYGGYTERIAGAVGGLILVAGVVSRPLGGVAATRWPHKRRFLVGVSVVATGLACLLLLTPRPLPLAILGTVGIGLASGLCFGPLTNGVTEVRPDAPGSAIALMNIPAIAVIMIAVPLFGASFDLPGGGRAGIAVIAALIVISVLALPSQSVFSIED